MCAIRPKASFTSENGATRPTSDFSKRNEGVSRFCSSKRWWTLSMGKFSMIVEPCPGVAVSAGQSSQSALTPTEPHRYVKAASRAGALLTSLSLPVVGGWCCVGGVLVVCWWWCCWCCWFYVGLLLFRMCIKMVYVHTSDVHMCNCTHGITLP